MKSKKIIFILFLLVAILQLLAPTKMIYDQENTLKNGKALKFLTEPIDPNDPFRGKYIRMNYDINSFNTKDTIWERKQEIYVYLNDSLGFATLKTVSKTKLEIDNNYVKAEVSWYDNYNNKLRFNLPFDRFYMEESKAKPAEDLVRINNRRDSLKTNITFAMVYLNDDKFVLENVFINDVSIKYLVGK
ncbi:GDYXXLXY domain-containing protein [Polaribacter sp. Asnod6-C07]|uniref:GDYXXLXY domain-containing protein n=1 Tax=Polaribacter sp. Asnod6-C07 TaxID=3160582 RepID=UPI003863E021